MLCLYSNELFFIKSSNKGRTFENTTRIVHNNFGESEDFGNWTVLTCLFNSNLE